MGRHKHHRHKAKTYQDIQAHARRRAKERYDLELNPSDYRSMNGIIQNQRSVKVLDQSNTRAWHRVTFRENVYLVVYDKRRHGIVTFLPPGADVNEGEAID